jgi:hypothetical protein
MEVLKKNTSKMYRVQIIILNKQIYKPKEEKKKKNIEQVICKSKVKNEITHEVEGFASGSEVVVSVDDLSLV